ncbi:Rossmann fold nucleotide-binding protein [Flexivirga sp. ID2601S]|uniref:Rossmann fold nucleotide-binding protein n=1 Tax=Flexivirga aerilata TaxID=1656889 RepID=A0A849AH38_9MICO|nr:LOG family protein [Flexivirga aerilata]NNG39765.1 Rossmann fold nucleotide-binding protein [Flexivirga aerilata]
MPAKEIKTVEELRALLQAGRPLDHVRLQDLDLTEVEPQLLQVETFSGLVVMGGRVSSRLDQRLRLHGALVFPTDPEVPFDPWSARLYRPVELYAGLRAGGYPKTPDSRTYQWALAPETQRDAYATLLRAVHDDSVTDALFELVDGRSVVGVMGGHALERGTTPYADAARLGHRLAQTGRVVTTGGGPGAMEAANLGAFTEDSAALDDALAELAAVPTFRPSIDDWATIALAVREQLVGTAPPTRLRSLGIPTWFYGHEPPNVFVDWVAKYFSNALREDLLLRVCGSGIVVLPGAAGTVQEIFQIVTPLYYAAPGTPLPPLVLVDRTYWTETIPVWPALQALGRDRPMAEAVSLVDDISQAGDALLAATT